MEQIDINIRLAGERDAEFLGEVDLHALPGIISRKISDGEIYIADVEGSPVAFLRYGWFWDNTPFMNLLFVLQEWQGKGIGRKLTSYWEVRMREKGASFVLTSTLANEAAQHFYRKCGYADIGGFVLPDEPLELILYKSLLSAH